MAQALLIFSVILPIYRASLTSVQNSNSVFDVGFWRVFTAAGPGTAVVRPALLLLPELECLSRIFTVNISRNGVLKL